MYNFQWWKNLDDFFYLCAKGQTYLVVRSSKQDILFRNRKEEGEILDVTLDARNQANKIYCRKLKERRRDLEEKKDALSTKRNLITRVKYKAEKNCIH